jgi:hypothetical protein
LTAWAVAIAASATTGLLSLIVLALGLSIGIPGGDVDVIGVGGVPHVAVFAIYLGLGAAAAAFALASVSPGWSHGQATRLGIAAIGFAISAATLGASDHISESNQLIVGTEIVPGRLLTAIDVCGWVGLAAAAFTALPIESAPKLRRPQASVAIAAALPFLLGAVAYVVIVAADVQLPDAARAAGIAEPIAWAGTPVFQILSGVSFLVGVLLLWQTVAGARTARDLGVGAARTIDRLPSLLAAFVVAKLVWLALGYLDLLPAALGGDNVALDTSRGDDLLSWIIAAALALVAGSWLRSRCELPLVSGRLDRATVFVIGGFLLATILSAITFIVYAGLAQVVNPQSWLPSAFANVTGWIIDRQMIVTVLTVLASGAAGALSWRRHGPSAASVFLVGFFILGVPRAIDITLSWGTPEGGSPGRMDLATLDTMITLVVAALLFVTPRDKRLVTDAGLALVIVVSTLIAYGGTIISGIWQDGAFYLALILPGAYGLLLGAREINRAGDRRVARALATAGGAAGLLAIVVVQLYLGFAGPGHMTEADLGRLLIAPPMAAALVAVGCSALRAGRPVRIG